MYSRKEKQSVTPEEIQELMDGAGWSEARLADECKCSPYAIRKWMLGENKPRGLAEHFIKLWLEQVRAGKQPTSVEALTRPQVNGKTNGHHKKVGTK